MTSASSVKVPIGPRKPNERRSSDDAKIESLAIDDPVAHVVQGRAGVGGRFLEAVALVCPARRVGASLGEAAEEYPGVGGPDESLGYGGVLFVVDS